MSLIDAIPKEYRVAEKLDEFLAWLAVMPAPAHTKKYNLLDWCEYTGVEMKREYAERAGIPLQI